MEKELINPLRNEKVTVRSIPQENGITDKNHMLYGGMAEGAVRVFTVPILASSGTLKNVLTNAEKDYFENLFGVDLSVHKKNNNYWENYQVILTKGDNYLDLSIPEDYIKYKILLANTDKICPSLKTLNDKPLRTYQYVITSDDAEIDITSNKRKLRVDCFKLAGKIQDDIDTLRTVIELLENRPIADKTSKEFLANKLDELIEINAKKVYDILTDQSLQTRVLLQRCIKASLVIKTGDFYYLKSGKTKTPMCSEGKDPDYKNAIQFLNNPKNQEIKFNLEAQINNSKED